MNNKIAFLLLQLVVAVAAFLFGKYVVPKTNNLKNSTAFGNVYKLEQWASKFVRWTREFMSGRSGTAKMNKATEMLKEIAAEAGIDVSEEKLQAIVQTAYEEMIAGMEAVTLEADVLEAKEAIAPQNFSIHIEMPNTENVAVATDNVPDGALDENPDGTVNAYDDEGNKVGTVTKEEAEEAASNVSKIIVEEE